MRWSSDHGRRASTHSPHALDDTWASDGFATAIATTGDGVLVAYRGADGVATNSGAVHFFRDLGDGLAEMQKITPVSDELERSTGMGSRHSGRSPRSASRFIR